MYTIETSIAQEAVFIGWEEKITLGAGFQLKAPAGVYETLGDGQVLFYLRKFSSGVLVVTLTIWL